MSAHVLVKQVSRYYCSFCGRGWQQQRRAARHVESCYRDPDTRACLSCAHYHREGGYEAGYLDETSCDQGHDCNPYDIRTHCDEWLVRGVDR